VLFKPKLSKNLGHGFHLYTLIPTVFSGGKVKPLKRVPEFLSITSETMDI
jgi:hypothetical protein